MMNIVNKKRLISVLAGILLSVPAIEALGADVTLYEWGINDGVNIYTDSSSLPAYINDSAFDFGTGLGSLTATLPTGNAGDHYFALYVDHEIDELVNTFYNEFGVPVNTPEAKQTWEIDEPGWVFGDIHDNFLAGTLDNHNGVPASAPDDVAMALAWNFHMDAEDTATVEMDLGTAEPTSGFYLKQTDVESGASVYFSSDLYVGPASAPDGGATIGCLAFALLGLEGLRRKLKRQ